MIIPSQRPLLTTHNTHNTNIHALGGIRTHDLSRRAAEDLRLRPHRHWDRLFKTDSHLNCIKYEFLPHREQIRFDYKDQPDSAL